MRTKKAPSPPASAVALRARLMSSHGDVVLMRSEDLLLIALPDNPRCFRPHTQAAAKAILARLETAHE